jgi:hypothetical protein
MEIPEAASVDVLARRISEGASRNTSALSEVQRRAYPPRIAEPPSGLVLLLVLLED